MIDREKLVELLKSLPQVNHAQAAVEGLEYVFGCAADYLIANGVTVQRWIPVTERLPEMKQQPEDIDGDDWWQSECVLLATTKGEVRDGYRCKLNEEYGWITKDYKDIEVTHWMPLPEPPRGE